ncbi:NrtA/SsuA/CpmA family ABC transporter substrate-binding protein [Desulfosporosinus sp. PR]|uniref:ABC transporter substrate-binding protein n=1 Tax=Candidatus Desulfosporosinus nitrosoreducens TaxID=3401928 RepID=UPI0027F1E775|nr:NrtA/SsuA/CpmA family ABC transporter substrate-binding protein [Desulfosporosinus sp. PR]MDQ7092975.1 NrtA/SsuA/CpmA family ABC transporter substrate-binding protein [Desulfosporosinus sp. PR]
MPKMFRPKMILGAVLFALLLSGCSSPSANQQQTSSELPKTINASYVSRPINVPSIVAQDKKLFETEFAKDNIQFKWHDLTTPDSQLEALASGSLDFANSLNNLSAILANANGNDIKVISSYSTFPQGIALVARANDGISKDADLKGKKIGLQSGTMLYQMLVEDLAKSNLKENDVTLVNMDSSTALTALLSGQIDATILPDPLLSKAMASGKAIKLRTAEGLISGLSVIAVRSDFAQKYPDLVKRFLAVHKQSLDWSNNNLDQALQLAAAKNQMDIKAVKKMYPEFSFAMSLNEAKQDLIQSAEFLKKEGMIPSNTDTTKLINDLVDTSFMPR